MSRAIFTTTVAATAKNPTRIKVQAQGCKVLFFPWDHEFEAKANHVSAASQYIDKLGLSWYVTGSAENLKGDGFVCLAEAM